MPFAVSVNAAELTVAVFGLMETSCGGGVVAEMVNGMDPESELSGLRTAT